MAKSIGQLVAIIGAEVRDFQEGMDKVKGNLAEVGNRFEDLTKKQQRAIKEMGVAMVAVGGAITAFAGLSIKQFGETGEALYEMSVKTGMSTEALSVLKYMAESTGASLETIEQASRSMANAVTGNNRAVQALGFSMAEIRAMSPDQAFISLASAVADVQDPLQRSAMAQDIFGRSALELLPIFADGSRGIEEMTRKAEDLGLVMSGQEVAAAVAMKNSFDDLGQSVKGLKEAIGNDLAPILTPMLRFFKDIVVAVTEWTNAHPGLTQAIAVLGGVVLGAGGLLVALAMVVKVLREVRTALIAVQAFMGPEGWINLAAGVALVGTTLYAIDQFTSSDAAYDPSNPYSGSPDTWPSVPGFADGGIVPGPIGAPMLAKVHGGETITPAGGGGNTYITITVEGSIRSDRDLLDFVKQGLISSGKANVSALGGYA